MGLRFSPLLTRILLVVVKREELNLGTKCKGKVKIVLIPTEYLDRRMPGNGMILPG